jgi:hypothetical protein
MVWGYCSLDWVSDRCVGTREHPNSSTGQFRGIVASGQCGFRIGACRHESTRILRAAISGSCGKWAVTVWLSDRCVATREHPNSSSGHFRGVVASELCGLHWLSDRCVATRERPNSPTGQFRGIVFVLYS